MKLSENEWVTARSYIQQQLAAHSWWPKEQPGEARHDFILMQTNANTLSAWCEKWLDAGQMRLLAEVLKHS
jgi:hypothetical protein